MMLTWIDGHLILALIAIPICSVWTTGIVNILLRRRGGAR